MQNKSRITSLNDKVGSVRNMISAFEQNDNIKNNNPVKSLLEENDKDRIIIEGDSRGILEIQYVASNNSNSIMKNNDRDNIHESNSIESINSINTIDDNKNIQNIDNVDTFKNEEGAKYDDQVNKLIEDYQMETSTSSNLNISDIAKDISSYNSYIIKDLDETGISQIKDNSVNIHSSTVMIEKNDEISDNQTSSIYQTDSETEDKKNELKVGNKNYSSETDESKSTWKDGELLIKKFGYNSTSTSNSAKNSKTNNPINSINDIYDNETIKCRDSIQSSPNSKKKVSIDWKFGDIDGLERISMKTASGSDHTNTTYNNLKIAEPSNIYYISNDDAIIDNTNINSTNQNFPRNNNSRRRSVNFKENTSENHYYNEKEDVPKGNGKTDSNLNPWKYISYGIILAVIILYMISLIYKEIFSNSNPPIILTEYDIMDYFNKISNDTRSILFDKLNKKYNITISNNIINNRNMNAHEYLKNKYLRETDDDINVKYNYFENINPRFKYDAEIQNLMESDNLRFMFSGVAYAPENVIEPKCGAQLRNVMLDIARLSKITANVKTYGTQCKQSELILEAIQQLNLNMTLSLGVWIGADDTINEIQLTEMKRVVQKYPRKYFRSIFIGNEVLYRGDKSITELMSYINETKIFLKSINYEDLPVGTSEIGSMINEEMFKLCDFVGANIHPFFAGVEAQYGTKWLLNYYYNELVPIKKSLNSSIPLIISEVGWPYNGGKFGDSVAGSWEFQQFLNDWLCTTPADILNESFYFEAFDEPWKNIWWDSDKTWETEWGFFSKDRMLKNHIYIPDCSKYRTLSVDDIKLIKFEDPYADDEVINVD